MSRNTRYSVFFVVFIFNKRRLQETVRPQVHSRTNQRDLKSPPLEPQTLITIRKYPHYIETHETLGITIYNVTLHFAPYTTLPPHIHIPPYPSHQHLYKHSTSEETSIFRLQPWAGQGSTFGKRAMSIRNRFVRDISCRLKFSKLIICNSFFLQKLFTSFLLKE